MPIKKAAYKHLRQAKQRTIKNRSEKNRVRSLTKKTLKVAAQGKSEEAQTLLRSAIKATDKAAQHGVFKKNAAARKKSRLVKRVHALLKQKPA